MSDAPLMLGVSGLRGIVGRSLTPGVAGRFAAAFGAWLVSNSRDHRRPMVVVGADGRAGYEPIAAAAMSGLIAAGCDVFDLGVAMTPTVGVVADHEAAAGGLIVTASHNPQEWNGLKCLVRGRGPAQMVDACAPGPALAQAIIAAFNSSKPSPTGAGPTSASAGAAPPRCIDNRATHGVGYHLGPVLGALRGVGAEAAIRARRFRVVLDSVNGAGRFAGRTLLAEALGCELIHLGAEDGGVFPQAPEPTAENLGSLCRAVGRFNADIGFAQDPDADRLAIINERGEYIGEEYTLALAAVALVEARRAPGASAPTDGVRPPVFVTNLSTSRMIDDIAAKSGGRVVRTPVGEANVVEAMKREAAAGHEVVLGGEGNGGVIWPRITHVRDSLSAMALVLALMAHTGKAVGQLVAEVPAYAIDKRKIALARKEDAEPALERLARAFAAPRVRIDRQDGVRIDLDARRAWLHVRASNTEPIMRLIAEAATPGEAGRLLDEAMQMARP